MPILHYLALFLAAFIGGSINAIAGGGTVISFPTLIWTGVPTAMASATNTLALWPASASASVALRDDVRGERRFLLIMLVPSLLGGLAGAWLLTVTPESLLRVLAPILVLFATLIFAGRAYLVHLGRKKATGPVADAPITVLAYLGGGLFQFLLALYGGYFGAGIGILMFSSFSIMGMSDLHRMNAVKNVCAAAINGIAIIFFAFKGTIIWPLGLLMAVGAIIGGYSTASMAKQINPRALRFFIIGAGLVASAYLFWRAFN